MKKIKLLLYNIKHSWLFLLVIFVELVLCIVMLSVALTNFFGGSNQFAYYNAKVADKSFVTFDGYDIANDTSADKVSQVLSDDLKSLATVVNLGEVQSEEVGLAPSVSIATPALVDNFNSKGLEFSDNLPDGYREAYIHISYSTMYNIGNIYEIAVDYYGEIYHQKIKIVGYIDSQDYYVFENGYIYFNSPSLVICDELPPFVRLSSGIFINDKNVNYYESFGFSAMTVEEYFDSAKVGTSFMTYLALAVMIILFTFVSIVCNYVLSIDKLSRRSASLYVCGNTYGTSVVVEGVKMLAVFLLAFVISLGITSIMVNVGMERQNIMITMPNFYLAVLIMFGLYLLAVIIGFVKFICAKPLKIISGTKN